MGTQGVMMCTPCVPLACSLCNQSPVFVCFLRTSYGHSCITCTSQGVSIPIIQTTRLWHKGTVQEDHSYVIRATNLHLPYDTQTTRTTIGCSIFMMSLKVAVLSSREHAFLKRKIVLQPEFLQSEKKTMSVSHCFIYRIPRDQTEMSS